MSDIAIHIDNVVKSFRRFSRPGWRAMDALGWRVPSKHYDTFFALRNLSLDVRRGEKVALIGRNGAGKSTLLRVICGQMLADSGSVAIEGKVQALMELGTGFHPDFTGIQNIRSSLAYQGITGKALNGLVDEIIDFTELDDFINRPVREYSAGMYARLAFAVATTITPDILIIDEILGAGDAYFVGKSIQRMRELTREGATILFVSHDMSAVQMLCERGVWIEKGKVRADGEILPVSKSYLASVREDEEARTRARSMRLSRREAALGGGRGTTRTLYRLVVEGDRAPTGAFSVADIRFGSGDQPGFGVSLEDDQAESRLIVDPGVTNWSKMCLVSGVAARQFAPLGGRFVHAPWQIDWSGISEADRWIDVTFIPSTTDAVRLEVYDADSASYKQLAQFDSLSPSQDQWKTVRIQDSSLEADVVNTADVIQTAKFHDLQELSADDRYGSGRIRVIGFGFYDRGDQRRHTLISGETVHAVVAYGAAEETSDPVAVVAVYRPDGTCAMQVTSNRDGYDLGVLKGTGKIIVSFDPLFLGPGDYVVSVALFKTLNVASRHEPEAYDLHDRCYSLKVLPPEGVGIDIGTVNQPALWEVYQ